MTLKNIRNNVPIRTSINYNVSLWDRCVPGKSKPAFVGLANTCPGGQYECLQNPLHKPIKHWAIRHGFRIFAPNPEVTKPPLGEWLE